MTYGQVVAHHPHATDDVRHVHVDEPRIGNPMEDVLTLVEIGSCAKRLMRDIHLPRRHPNPFARVERFRYPAGNTPATLSPVSTGDAHNWRVFIA